MALASILVGIVTGVLSFGAALIAGHGLALAVGFYVMGGLFGTLVALMLVAMRLGLQRLARPAGRLQAIRG